MGALSSKLEILRTNNVIKIIGPLSSSSYLLANIHQATEKAGFEEITLDFGECTSAFASTMLPICAQVIEQREKGIYTKIELPEDQKLNKLFVNTNWSSLLDPRRYDPTHKSSYLGNVTATQYKTAAEQHQIINRIVNVLLGIVPEMERQDFAAFEWSLNEITDNVLTHANSDIGGLVQLSIFKQTKKVQYVVADAGIGIPNSMRSGAYPKINDKEALELAVREGVTRDKSLGQGNGLFGSFEIAHHSHGTFQIKSCNAHLTLSSKGVEVGETKSPYKGTVVVAEINFSEPGLLAEALKFGGKKYTPSNDYLESAYEHSEGNIIFNLKNESESFGSRPAGLPIRNKLLNIFKMDNPQKIKIDFEGIHIMSSSFADEAFGKLFKEIGPIEFMKRIEFLNITQVIQSLIDKAITQRMKE